MQFLYMHTEKNQYDYRLFETKKFVEETNKYCNWIDVLTTIKDEYSQIKALKQYWGKDDIVILEEDKLPSYKMVFDIAYCIKPICSQYYWLHRYDTDRNGWLPNVPMGLFKRFVNEKGFRDYRPLTDTEEYGDYTDIGLFKISKKMQLEIDLDKVGHNSINTEISNIIEAKGLKIHAHKEIMKHNHVKLCKNLMVDLTTKEFPNL